MGTGTDAAHGARDHLLSLSILRGLQQGLPSLQGLNSAYLMEA